MIKRFVSERRRHPRVSYVWPVQFSEVNGKTLTPFRPGKSKNLSQGGMKITVLHPLNRDTAVLLDTNLDRLSIHIKLKDILVVSKARILAEVAWRHLNLETGFFETGFLFVHTHRRQEFESLMAQTVAT